MLRYRPRASVGRRCKLPRDDLAPFGGPPRKNHSCGTSTCPQTYNLTPESLRARHCLVVANRILIICGHAFPSAGRERHHRSGTLATSPLSVHPHGSRRDPDGAVFDFKPHRPWRAHAQIRDSNREPRADGIWRVPSV